MEVLFAKNEREANILGQTNTVDLFLVAINSVGTDDLDPQWASKTHVLFLDERHAIDSLPALLELGAALHTRPTPNQSSPSIDISTPSDFPKKDRVAQISSSIAKPWQKISQWIKKLHVIDLPIEQETRQSHKTIIEPVPIRPHIPDLGIPSVLKKPERFLPEAVTEDLWDRNTINGFLLGPFQIALNGILVKTWPSKKGRSMLAYLLYNHRRPCLRDVLMEKFWPEVAPDSARNSLNVAMYGLRRLLKRIDNSQDYILFKNESYCMNPELEINLDHENFLDFWRRAQQLERTQSLERAVSEYEHAVEVYKGEFLEDDLYDDWSTTPRAKMREAYLYALDRLSLYYLNAAHYDNVIRLCKGIIEKDNCREDIHRRLMKSYYYLGHREKAIKQFYSCESLLKIELDVTPSTHTLDLLSKIRDNQLVLNPSDA